MNTTTATRITTATAHAPLHKVGDTITHERFGKGKVLAVIPATTADEETEYTVKLRSDRYPANLGESGILRADETMAWNGSTWARAPR